MSVSDAQLAQMRAQRTSILRDSCALYAPVESTDPDFGAVKSWPTVTTTVACNVVSNRAGFGAVNQDDTMVRNSRRIAMPYGTTIAEGWRIVWSDLTLDVLDLLPRGSHGVDVTVICAEVEP